MSLPKPYYQDEQATIYCADCRDVLPHLGKFDLLLTDPPYGIGYDGKKASTSSHGGRKPHAFMGWDNDRPSAELLASAIQTSDNFIIWGGNYLADVLPRTKKWLVWDKGQRIAQSDCELAATSFDGALRVFTLNRVELLMDGTVHPSQKPVKLMSWCIIQAGPVESILDPFMGSGTTLIAAKLRGIRAVGIELEEKYCAMAVERLRQGVLITA